MEINTSLIAQLLRERGMPAAADAVLRGEAVFASACELAGFNRPAEMDPQAQAQAARANAMATAAAAAGAMVPYARDCGGDPRAGAGVAMNLPGVGTYPGCYSNCSKIDPCLLPYLQNQALQLDAWALLEYYKNESDLVHINKYVGAAPFVPPSSLTDNTATILAQEDSQQLAYIPGLLKVSANFSDGKDHQTALGLTFFSGPRQLTAVTSTLGAFVQIGKPFTFEDFVCGTACYLAPFPDLFGCPNRVIPGERSVYAVVALGALPDGVTLTGISVVVIKSGTKQYANCCSGNPALAA